MLFNMSAKYVLSQKTEGLWSQIWEDPVNLYEARENFTVQG
jgi:hypothetical protein